MVHGEVTVINDQGLHLRPAGVLVKKALEYQSRIYLYNGDRQIIAKSVLNIMAAAVRKGTVLKVECDGPDEEEALSGIIEAVSKGLGDGTEYNSEDRLF